MRALTLLIVGAEQNFSGFPLPKIKLNAFPKIYNVGIKILSLLYSHWLLCFKFDANINNLTEKNTCCKKLNVFICLSCANHISLPIRKASRIG